MRAQGDWREVEETIRSYLGLKYHLVGVKLLKKDAEGWKDQFKPARPMAYCQMVRMASSRGESFLYDRDDEACPTAQVVLGFREQKYTSVEHRVQPSDTMKVLVAPLDQMREDPDIVLATLTPRQMMDLTILLQAGKQELLSVEFRGEAACAEFTAKPYMEHRPNLSLLCNGARVIYSDFRDNELIFGAPPEIYVQAAEIINKIIRTGGALCGCRTSDIPTSIINEFERAGLSKGTDYFFGKVSGRNIRAYLNKDFQGRLKFVTIHLPVKMPLEREAEKAAERLKRLLSRPYRASQRGYWLDLTMTASEDELGIDLMDGETLKVAIEKFIDKSTQYLRKAGIEV